MPADRAPIAVGNRLFHVLLGIVTAINAGTLLIMVALAFWGHEPPTRTQEALLELCRYAFTTTPGAVVGLLCGRGAGPDYLGELPGKGR